MKTEALIRPVRAGDAEALAAAMREEDAAEVRASNGHGPLEALRDSISTSKESYAVELAGELAAIFGVREGPRSVTALDAGATYDIVWMLTGRAVRSHRAMFWRASQRHIKALLERYPVLLNLVDARYAAALKWARRLGAEILPASVEGRDGVMFHPVIWRSPWAQQAQ